MNWKVNTIANRDNAQRRPENGLPIRIASRGVLPSQRIAKSSERGGALALVRTPVEGALERSRPEAEGVISSCVEGESASSFLVAIQIVRDSDLGDGPLDAVSHDVSLGLLPLDELIARVRVALTRNHAFGEERALFRVGELHLDVSRHLVQKRGRPVHLTPKEFALLHNLMISAGKPVPHRKLLRSVWGSQYGCEREYLRIFVRQLRLKIEDDPGNPKYLLTEPNIGYRFAEFIEGDSGIPSSDPVISEA